jgi:hypothetical protein
MAGWVLRGVSVACAYAATAQISRADRLADRRGDGHGARTYGHVPVLTDRARDAWRGRAAKGHPAMPATDADDARADARRVGRRCAAESGRHG